MYDAPNPEAKPNKNSIHKQNRNPSVPSTDNPEGTSSAASDVKPDVEVDGPATVEDSFKNNEQWTLVEEANDSLSETKFGGEKKVTKTNSIGTEEQSLGFEQPTEPPKGTRETLNQQICKIGSKRWGGGGRYIGSGHLSIFADP